MKKPSSDTMRCQRCAACVVDTIVYVGLIALGLGVFFSVVFRSCGRLEMGKASY
jgi:hypothetical protein